MFIMNILTSLVEHSRQLGSDLIGSVHSLLTTNQVHTQSETSVSLIILHFPSLLQFTRDALIVLAGSKAKGRTFVYFTEVKNIPSTDLATIERLWNKFSGGKFGYSVQKKKYRQSKGDFELFCRKIGWSKQDGEYERKKRWFGASEFTYDVKKAPEGHLPLTSALRGTSLIKRLLEHPVFDNDDWMKEP